MRYSPGKNSQVICKAQKLEELIIISLHKSNYLQLFKTKYYSEQPFTIKPEKKLNRYYFGNNTFEYCDAVTLYCMLRYLKPKRVIEIGSDFSSAVMLDVNEQFLNNSIDLTFIEPYPERLNLLLTDKDKKSSHCLFEPIQNIDLNTFSKLEAGDILFDSSHVSKIGSDVNYIIFNIPPIFKQGVFIHFMIYFIPLSILKNGRNKVFFGMKLIC